MSVSLLSRIRAVLRTGQLATLVSQKLGLYPAPVKGSGKAFDLFLTAGQSNCVGGGNASGSPTPEKERAIAYDRALEALVNPLTDPVRQNGANANTGSAWPKFCTEYIDRTGRNIAIAGAAANSSGQSRRARDDSHHWDHGGTLFGEAVETVRNAIKAIENAGHATKFRGVLWHQGERDAQEIDAGGMTKEHYKRAFQTMNYRFRSEFGDDMKMWLFELGRPQRDDTVGFQAVRGAQREVEAEQDGTHIVSTKQVDFPELGYMRDSLHYNQDGLNLMGETAAKNVSHILFEGNSDLDIS